MVSFRPLSRESFPFQIGVSWLINGGDPNYLLTGMILQVDPNVYLCECIGKARDLLKGLICDPEVWKNLVFSAVKNEEKNEKPFRWLKELQVYVRFTLQIPTKETGTMIK